jgi:hypothetical protein
MASLPKYRPRLCPKHEERRRVGYLDWHAIAERLARRGVEQKVCAVCGCWTWPFERCEQFAEAATAEETDPAVRRVMRRVEEG